MSEPTIPSNPQEAKPSRVPIVVTGLFLLVAFWLAGRWLLAVTPSVTDEEAARSVERVQILEEVRAADEEKLNTYGWVDREAGIVRIPVERAMELELAQLREQGDPRPAYPVAAATAVPTGDAAEDENAEGVQEEATEADDLESIDAAEDADAAAEAEVEAEAPATAEEAGTGQADVEVEEVEETEIVEEAP